MNISKDTLSILQNFSEINPSLVFNEGSELKTMSPLKNILAKTSVTENFPRQFGIYDLTNFVNNIQTMGAPDFDFNETHVTLKNTNKDKLKYFYCDPSIITSPEKDIDLEDITIEFSVSKTEFDKVIKYARANNLQDFMIKGCSKSGQIIFSVFNKATDTSTDFSTVIGTTDKNFKLFLKIETIKLLSGDYDVKVSTKGVVYFKNQNIDLEYWVALEPDSKYE